MFEKTYIRLLIAALAVFASTVACQLEGDEESLTLPTAGYDTFKILTDRVGDSFEINANGKQTGRIGFYWDRDLDGIGDQFYQVSKPHAGIVGLSFGEDGFADGGRMFGGASIIPWKTQYEVPVDVLTHWVLGNAALGYRKGEYVDDFNTLVYMDRVNDVEAEAALTGERESRVFNFVSLGTVNVSQSQGQSIEDEGGEIEPSRAGDLDARCPDYKAICRDMQSVFADGWTVADCMQNMFNRNDGNFGTRYNSCLINDCEGRSGDGMANCIQDCAAEHLEDAYGCGGEKGPELNDVLYIVVPDGANSPLLADKGITISANESLAVYFQYKDAECNFNGGQVIVEINGNKTKLALPNADLGCDSFEKNALLGFTFTGLSAGEYEFTITLTDGDLVQAGYPNEQGGRVLSCNKAGTPYIGAFNVENEHNNDAEIGTFKQKLDVFEVYDTELNPYNIGKGFIEPRVVGSQYLFDFEEFDIAFIQGYIWSTQNTETFADWNFTSLNNAIFTTTLNDRATKFDETDDVQSYAFYIDQPLASGLFTFYGDTGWNLYPKGPAGDNDDQVFVRGSFEDTQIYVPFERYTPVKDREPADFKYVGSYIGSAIPEVWAGFMFDQYPDGLDLGNFDGMNREEFVANFTNHPLNSYWRCAVPCMKRTMEELNGCQTLDDCVSECGGSPTDGSPNPLKIFDNLYIDVEVTVPPEFTASETYASYFEADANGNLPLRVGLYAATNSGSYKGVPSGYVQMKKNPATQEIQTKYRVPLPYFPYEPLDFLPINGASSAGQAQIYLAVFDENNVAFGTPVLPAGGGHAEEWSYLVLFSYNWVSPTQYGWALSELEGNSISAFVNPFTTIVPITFGKLGAIDGEDLVP